MSASDKNPMVLVEASAATEGAGGVSGSIRSVLRKLDAFLKLEPSIHEKKTRGRGSLAHLVGLINSANIAVITILLLNDIGLSSIIIAIGVLIFAFFGHERYINWTEITTKAATEERRFTHSGGIIFRKKRISDSSSSDPPYDQEIEYLVTTNKEEKHEKEGKNYLFPKGHIELGEELAQAALREVFEETGVVGRIVRPIGSYVSNVQGNYQRTKFYLIECLQEVEPNERREKNWLEFEEARQKLTYIESKNMLLHAHSFLETVNSQFTV
jgi:8-oxo-dGTP pyrophosphatase MutT (NUDIX family)